MHAVRSWMKLRRAADLCAAQGQVENRIEINEVNTLPSCDLTDGLAIGFQLEVLSPPQVLVNDGWSQQINRSGCVGLELLHHLRYQASVGLEVNAPRRVVEAVPNIVHSARQRHDGGLLVDYVLLQTSRHVRGFVTANPCVHNLYSQIRIETRKDPLHQGLITTSLSNAVSERHDAIPRSETWSGQGRRSEKQGQE